MPKLFTNILKILISCYVLICGFIWLLSPWVISQNLKPFLAENGLLLAEKSTIRYNPFITVISISEFEVASVSDESQTPLLHLNSAKIELSLWELLHKTIHVNQINVDGLKLNIAKSDKQMVIGGWEVPDSSSSSTDEAAETENVPDAYQLQIPDIKITNSLVSIDWLGNAHTIDLSKLNLNQLALNTQKQQGNIDLAFKVNESPIKLNAEFNLDQLIGDIRYKLAIDQLNLAKFEHFAFPKDRKSNKHLAEDSISSGLLSLNYQHKITLEKQNIKTELADIELTLNKLIAHIQGANLAVSNQQLSTKTLQLDILNWQQEASSLVINGQTNYQLNELNAYTEQTNLSLANINKLSIPKILLSTNESKHYINLPKIALEQANFSDDTKDETPSLARFKSMNLFDLKLSEDGLSIENIDILGLGIDIKKTKNSELAGLIKLDIHDKAHQEQLNADINKSIDKQLKKSPTKKFPIAIKQIQLRNTSHINLIDESVKPTMKRLFDINQLSAGPIDNQNPEQLSILTMDGSSNKYAHFKFKAETKPFATTPYYKLSGLFKEVSLPAISTYIKDALEYEFDSGQLDLDIDVTVDNTDVNGTTKIALRGVELGAANNPNDETLSSSSTIPFNYALGMLKDGDGNVELEIPLKGSTTDPDFSMQGFVTLLIKRATMAAAKEYLITTFVPYANIVKVSLFAGDYLLKVRFNDLPLTTGKAEIPVEALPFLEQFSALMNEKESTDITICAYAIPKDIGIESSIIKLTEVQHKQLKELSLTRMRAFKNYMVSEQGIQSSRLLLCSPKVDKSEDAQARLTFSD